MKSFLELCDGYKTYFFGLLVMAGGVGLSFVPALGPAVGVTVIGIGGSIIGGAHKAQKLTDAMNSVGDTQKQAVIDAVLQAAKAEVAKSSALTPATKAALESAGEAVAKKVMSCMAVLLLGTLAIVGSGCAAATQYQETHDDECLVACAVRGGIECKNQYDESQDGQLLAQCITLKGVDCSMSCRKPAGPAATNP